MPRKKIASEVGKVDLESRARVGELLSGWRALCELDDALAALSVEPARRAQMEPVSDARERAADEAREVAAWRDLIVLVLDQRENAPAAVLLDRVAAEWDRRWMQRATPVIARALSEHRTDDNEIPSAVLPGLAQELTALWFLKHPAVPFEVTTQKLSNEILKAQGTLGSEGPVKAARMIAGKMVKKSAKTAGRAATLPKGRARIARPFD